MALFQVLQTIICEWDVCPKVSLKLKKQAWDLKKGCLTIQIKMPGDPKKMHDNPNKDAWQSPGIFSWIISDIQKYYALQLAVQNSVDYLDNCHASFFKKNNQAPFREWSGIFLG